MLPVRESDRVDDLLDLGALCEVALVLLASVDDLLHEVVHQVRVEERRPRLTLSVTGREEALGDLHRDELDGLRLRAAERLAFAELLDESADQCALGSVDPSLDAGIVPDRDE